MFILPTQNLHETVFTFIKPQSITNRYKITLIWKHFRGYNIFWPDKCLTAFKLDYDAHSTTDQKEPKKESLSKLKQKACTREKKIIVLPLRNRKETPLTRTYRSFAANNIGVKLRSLTNKGGKPLINVYTRRKSLFYHKRAERRLFRKIIRIDFSRGGSIVIIVDAIPRPVVSTTTHTIDPCTPFIDETSLALTRAVIFFQSFYFFRCLELLEWVSKWKRDENCLFWVMIK